MEKIRRIVAALVLGLSLGAPVAAFASAAPAAPGAAARPAPSPEDAAIEYSLAERVHAEGGGEASYGDFDCYLDCRLSGLSMKFCWIACTASDWPF